MKLKKVTALVEIFALYIRYNRKFIYFQTFTTFINISLNFILIFI